jgi:acyl carrier protein
MDVEEQLVKYFKEHGDVDVAHDTPLVEHCVIDSMGVMELIAFIVETFNLQLDMDDLTIDNFATIDDIKNLIVRKRERNEFEAVSN